MPIAVRLAIGIGDTKQLTGLDMIARHTSAPNDVIYRLLIDAVFGAKLTRSTSSLIRRNHFFLRGLRQRVWTPTI